jgi:hypothetical protein
MKFIIFALQITDSPKMSKKLHSERLFPSKMGLNFALSIFISPATGLWRVTVDDLGVETYTFRKGRRFCTKWRLNIFIVHRCPDEHLTIIGLVGDLCSLTLSLSLSHYAVGALTRSLGSFGAKNQIRL